MWREKIRRTEGKRCGARRHSWRSLLCVSAQHSDAPVLKATEICQWWTSHAWRLMNFGVAWQPVRPLSLSLSLSLYLNLCLTFVHYLAPFSFSPVLLSRFTQVKSRRLCRSQHDRGNLLCTRAGVKRRSRGSGGEKTCSWQRRFTVRGSFLVWGTYTWTCDRL